jgi:hypothetical protein
LYEDGYTVPGARKFLAAQKNEKENKPKPEIPTAKTRSMLAELKTDLEQLKEMLEKK